MQQVQIAECEEDCLHGCPQAVPQRKGKHCDGVRSQCVSPLPPLPLPWLSISQSENGHLTKTRSVGHQHCSIATSRLLQKKPTSVTTAPVLHSSGWGTIWKVWASGANKPAICFSQMAFCCWLGLYYSPQTCFAGRNICHYQYLPVFFFLINQLITESKNAPN